MEKRWSGWVEAAAGLAVGGLVLAVAPCAAWWWLALTAGAVGAQRGYGAGLATGAAAGALLMAASGEAPGSVLALVATSHQLPTAIGLALLGGAVGLVGDGHRARLMRAEAAHARVMARLAEIEARERALAEEKAAAERRLAAEVLPLDALKREAAAIEGLPEPALTMGALFLLKRFLAVESAALYVAEGDGLRLATALGDRPGRPVAVEAASTLGAIARAGDVVMAGEHDFGGLMAAPLPGPDGSSRGVLVIEQLPFENLHDGAARMVAHVAALLAAELPLLRVCPPSMRWQEAS